MNIKERIKKEIVIQKAIDNTCNNMRITLKNIREFRQYNSRSWHDKDWHDFMKSEKSIAIQEAISDREPYDTDRDIADRAKVLYERYERYK